MRSARALTGVIIAAALAAGATAAPASARSCGSWGEHYNLIALRGASCTTARNVLNAFDAGQGVPVPGARNMTDSQLPTRVKGYRCGGLQGRVLCIKGNWTTINPPPNRPLVEAILRMG